MKDLKFQQFAQMMYYTWQVHLWLDSLRDLGHSDKAIVLCLFLKVELKILNGIKLLVYILRRNLTFFMRMM
jgi:hypothetical protein